MISTGYIIYVCRYTQLTHQNNEMKLTTYNKESKYYRGTLDILWTTRQKAKARAPEENYKRPKEGQAK